jgi:hypothetical protein
MKTLIFASLFLLGSVSASQAQNPAPSSKGVSYGSSINQEGAISIREMENRMGKNKFEGKIRGKVAEVCQEKGCWMKLENAQGEKLMVKFKDYAFFMPKDIVGKEVVLDGEATVNKVSVKQQKHYAEDAGKSASDISKIKAPKKEMQFEARGVLVL